MGDEVNNKPAIPFPNQATVPLIGQPRITRVRLPIDVDLTCPCGGADVAVLIVAGAPGSCPSCGVIYNVGVNLPLQLLMTQPEKVSVQ